MTDLAFDALDRVRLDWPEPVVIDLIIDRHGVSSGEGDDPTAARLHARFLRELVEGDASRACAQRLELIASCAARGIGPDAIEAADHAVFRELIRIVETRFRNSPRLQLHFLQRLDAALRHLPSRKQARPAVVSSRQERAPLRLGEAALAFSG